MESIDRQVRYNSRRAEKNSETMEWFFLILNEDKREISDITSRIYDLFAPIENEGIINEGYAKKAGLTYKFINFESRKKFEKDQIRTVYHGRLLLDRKLYRRENQNGLEKYIEEQVL
jgi:hypothetical protein